MKRYGNLMEQFKSEDNIRKAIKLSKQGGKGKRPNIIKATKDEDWVVRDIINMINNNTFPPHKYRKKVIYEGKKRNIYVIDYYPWRIIHFMIINLLEPIFEKTFITHTYGCIKGRGQHRGSKQCQKFSNHFKYILKCDIRKFYPSINQQILSDLIKRKIKDQQLLSIIDIVVFSHTKGVPIGNLPSQLFGNIYLSKLDNYVKHELKFKHYIRYVDDFIFASNDKEELRQISKTLDTWLKNNLGLTMSKNQIFKATQGIDFLGYRHFQFYRLLRQTTAKRLKRKINHIIDHYYNGSKSYNQCLSALASYEGWIKPCNSYNYSKKVDIETKRLEIILHEFAKNPRNINLPGNKICLNKLDSPFIIVAYKFKRIKFIEDTKIKHKTMVQFLVYFEDNTRTLYKCESIGAKLVAQFLALNGQNNIKASLVKEGNVYALK